MSDPSPLNNQVIYRDPDPHNALSSHQSLEGFFFTSFIKNLVNIDPHNFVTDIGGNSLSNRWEIKQLNHRQLFTSCKATFLQFMDFLLLLKHLMRLTWVGNVPYRIHKIIPKSFLSEFTSQHLVCKLMEVCYVQNFRGLMCVCSFV